MPSTDTIANDIPCRACAYNLRGLKFDGVCPECGEPIANSFHSATAEMAKLLDEDPVNMAHRLKFQSMADKVGCSVDALLFVLDSVSQALEKDAQSAKTPSAICAAVRSRAKRYFTDDDEATELLNDWGIRTGEDIGKIALGLAVNGFLQIASGVTLNQFSGLFFPLKVGNSMDKRPIIGITLDQHDQADKYESPFSYAKAIERAGGLPLLIPYQTDLSLIPQFVDLFDGILLSGGNDLDPALYGQEWHAKAQRIDPARQKFELALLAEVERRKTPILGVCLGSQIMNVYRGGSMHQFLPDITQSIEHRKVGEELTRHNVTLDPNSKIAQAIGKSEISVNTYHKQSADRIGRGLKVIATAPDGVIEGFEDPTFPLFAAVQWHPERLIDEPEHLAPFKLLVDVSRAAASK
jgi:putative glutamine amidotransferase